ncbi:hypothetical protein RUMLAC_00867 [[Ruminococcus] lactaris ATCC 29176]|uniref:Uncharacterized protein n=1 Tax=[Ruminococcus] lactaris ATCC 29176 TaxID=471875 RepID=B5CN20_9FIRM|nr:hypothetical protein RUMLAC_00867 [[Ruminococcus] lactaris ATCC 29176]
MQTFLYSSILLPERLAVPALPPLPGTSFFKVAALLTPSALFLKRLS